MTKLSGAIVVGGYANGLTVVRALSKLNQPITVVVTRPTDIAQYSKWATDSIRLLQFHQDPGTLIDLLLERHNLWTGRVVFPTNDHAATILAQNRKQLSLNYSVVMPEWEKAQILLDKQKTLQLASRLGVDIPRVYGSTDQLTVRQEIRFPVVVKPRQSHLFFERFRKKLFVANDAAELNEAISIMKSENLVGLIQEWVPGPDSCFYNYSIFIDGHGEPHGGFGMHKLRKAPPFFGVCRVAATAEMTNLRKPTLAVLREIGWRGMANAEYKLDTRDGRYKLMEINGRCFLMQGIPLRAGINYPMMAYRDLSGQPVSCKHSHWKGVWIHLHADMVYSLLARRNEQLTFRQFWSPYMGAKTFAVWDTRDLRPFLMQWLKSLGLVLRITRSEDLAAVRSGIEQIPRVERSG